MEIVPGEGHVAGGCTRYHVASAAERIAGLADESLLQGFIEDGAQGPDEHTYGKSITDPCLGWEKTEKLILELADKL